MRPQKGRVTKDVYRRSGLHQIMSVRSNDIRGLKMHASGCGYDPSTTLDHVKRSPSGFPADGAHRLSKVMPLVVSVTPIEGQGPQ